MKSYLVALLERMPSWFWRIVATVLRPFIWRNKPKSSGRTLIVLDPSYLSTVGHHHALNQLLIETCDGDGLNARVLAGRYLHASLQSGQVRRTFRCNVYDECHDALAFEERRQRTRRQVQVDMALRGVAPMDAEATILIHTVAATEASAILEALRQLRVRCTVNIFLMFPPEYSVSLALVPVVEALYVRTQAEAIAAGQHVNFWCDSAALVRRFTGIGMRSVKYHCFPSMVPDIMLTPRGPSHDALVFLFIGDARHEKGAELVGQALALLAKMGLPVVIRFRLTSLPKALAPYLENLPAGLVDLKVTHFIPGEKYFREIAAADFVLLPYDPQAYRTRSSNIAAEATAMGTPSIVPPRPNALVDFYELVAPGSCIEMQSYDAAGMAAAIATAVGEAAAIRKVAAEYAPAVRKQRDPTGFLRAMT
jgi:glycosyltransferase involved in cell wall biosynthesis